MSFLSSKDTYFSKSNHKFMNLRLYIDSWYHAFDQSVALYTPKQLIDGRFLWGSLGLMILFQETTAKSWDGLCNHSFIFSELLFFRRTRALCYSWHKVINFGRCWCFYSYWEGSHFCDFLMCWVCWNLFFHNDPYMNWGYRPCDF